MRSKTEQPLGSSVRGFGGLALAIAMATLMIEPTLLAQSRHDEPSHQRCIGIVTPTVEGVPGSSTDAAKAIGDLMASYLQGPSIRAVVLEAKLPSQAAQEAKQKGCEPVLFVALKRKSGGNRTLMQALGRSANASTWSLPIGSSAGSAVARAGATAGLQAVSSIAESTKAKDEVRLEYRLQSAAGQVQFGPKTEHQTAKADGEDLLTPVVMRVAEAIVNRDVATRSPETSDATLPRTPGTTTSLPTSGARPDE
jgi:hypothetical protein